MRIIIRKRTNFFPSLRMVDLSFIILRSCVALRFKDVWYVRDKNGIGSRSILCSWPCLLKRSSRKDHRCFHRYWTWSTRQNVLFDSFLLNELRILRRLKHHHFVHLFYGAVIDVDAGTVVLAIELGRVSLWLVTQR